MIGLLPRRDAPEAVGPKPVIPKWMGCHACDVRWVDNELCWMCGRVGEPSWKPSIGYMGLVPMGMSVAINRARINGPVMSDDPSGGGPL